MADKKTKKQKYDPTKEMNDSEKTKREVFEWVSTFAQALFAVVIVFTFLFRFVTVSGESMEHTLSNQDRLIISDINYTPARGDIVVVHDPDEKEFTGPVIKRIIATEGETVMVDYNKEKIYIKGVDGKIRLLDEWYIEKVNCNLANHYDAGRHYWNPLLSWTHPKAFGVAEIPGRFYEDGGKGIRTYEAVFTVGEGQVFVCGDNRAHSLDSRYVGPIDERKILGKVLFRLLPNPSIMNHTDYKNVDKPITVQYAGAEMDIDGRIVAKK